MKQVEWESILLQHLKPLGDEERFQIAEYYREIYADKLEMGATPDAVLAEFGNPEECAQKILQEAGKDVETVDVEESKLVTPLVETTAEKPVVQKSRRKWTPSITTGMVFLTLLVILPLAGSAVGVIASFAACAIAGGATSLAGGIYAVCSLFFGGLGMETSGIFAHFGMGLAAIGVGFLMCVGFYYATKYTAIACWKALRWIYNGGD